MEETELIRAVAALDQKRGACSGRICMEQERAPILTRINRPLTRQKSGGKSGASRDITDLLWQPEAMDGRHSADTSRR
jgi:hypothetical protein